MLRYEQPYPIFFYMSVKETQLRVYFFPLKFMQIAENTLDIMHHPRLFADFVIKAHQFHIVGTVAFITVSELPDVHFLQAGKMPVQLSIEIFPVAFPEGQAHVEAQHTPHPGIDTDFQNPFYILPGIIDIRKDWTQPDHRGDPRIPELLQRRHTLRGHRNIGFQDPAEVIVMGGEGHLHHRFAFFIDLLQQIQIPEDSGGFCLDGHTETVSFYDLQRPPGHPEVFFQGDIGIRHGTCADHAALLFGQQRLFQQFQGIFLDLDIFKGVIHLIASAAGIAVDAAVGTAPVQIHTIVI